MVNTEPNTDIKIQMGKRKRKGKRVSIHCVYRDPEGSVILHIRDVEEEQEQVLQRPLSADLSARRLLVGGWCRVAIR
jgi:hypothetical protein